MLKNCKSVNEILKESILILKKKGIETAHLDSEILLAEALNISREKLLLNQNYILSSKEKRIFLKLLNRRLEDEPIAYILGYKEFYEDTFIVNKNVLIPRPETEFLIEAFLEIFILFNNKNIKVLDVGCGSGIIGITLKKLLPEINIIMSDISKQAIKVTKKNIKRILGKSNIKVVYSDIFKNIKDKFNVIISNPPYIPSKTIFTLMKDVKNYEPQIALDGGEDGLLFYKNIIANAYKYLYSDGYLILELNPELKGKIIELFKKNKYKIIDIKKDYSNFDRVIVAELVK